MFIDLATDLALSTTVTGRTLAEFVLDEHRTLSTEADTPGGLAVASLTNQLDRGVDRARLHTERADRELDASSARLDVDRHTSARAILAEPTGSATGRDCPCVSPRTHLDVGGAAA